MLLRCARCNPNGADQNEGAANDRVDRMLVDVPVDRFFTNLFGRASHDRRHRRICGGVDLDPGGQICGDAVGAQKTKTVLATKGTKDT